MTTSLKLASGRASALRVRPELLGGLTPNRSPGAVSAFVISNVFEKAANGRMKDEETSSFNILNSSFASWRLCVKSHCFTQSRKGAKNTDHMQDLLTGNVPVKPDESEEVSLHA